jgi:hypothetical protein
MATNTTKLGLIKPDFTDVVDVTDLNSNADDIDAAVGATIVTSTTRPTVPFAGQTIFETDTESTLVWSGTAWKEVSSLADGSVTAAKLASDAVETAKINDLAVTTAKIADANVTNLKLGAGTIRQVVHVPFTSSYSTGSTAYQESPMTASITPTSTSSRILVMFEFSTARHFVNSHQMGGYVVARNNDIGITSPIGDTNGSKSRVSKNSTSSSGQFASQIIWLDHPNTTSSTTYTLWMRMLSGTGAIGINVSNDTNSSAIATNASSITLMEVTF